MAVGIDLPLRTCSRCINWCRYATTPDDTGRKKAPCLVLQNEPKYGGDTCGKWTRRE